MRNIKKLVLVLVMVLTVVALVGCSSSPVSNIAGDFEEEGYNMYEYKNYVAANFDIEDFVDFDTDEDSTSTEEDDGEGSVDRISTNAMFIPVDYMSLELRAYILNTYEVTDQSAMDEITIEEYPTLTNIQDLTYDVYVFAYSEQVTLVGGAEQVISKTAVVIEFESPEYLQEVLDISDIIQAQLDGYDVEDHVNGSLLLLVPTTSLPYYDEIVTLFNQSEE